MRLYRWLARCFPRSFRQEFERELETAAADMLSAERSKGLLHRVRLWIGLAADLVVRGFAERRASLTPRASAGTILRSIGVEWRQALRGLAGRPAFVVTTIALLGLAMSANSAVFSVVNAALLRPLPFANPDRLVLLWESYEPMHLDTMPWSEPDYLSARQATTLADTAIFHGRRLVLRGNGDPVALRGIAVEGNIFELLGTTSAYGRLLTRADSQPSSTSHVVVLSHDAWMSRFGGDPGIVGRAIVLDNESWIVVGVAAEGFSFPPAITMTGQMLTGTTDVYVPYVIDPSASRGSHSDFAVGRLRDGAGISQATADVAAIGARLEHDLPDTNANIHMRVEPLQAQSVVTIRAVLLVLLAAVAGVLLIACASISNLMLARGSSRAPEMALRTALGATRASLVRQLLMETALLGAGGTLVGLLAARGITRALVALNPISAPEMFRSSYDWRVFGFTIVMTLAAVIAAGLAPALSGSRVNLSTILRSGARTTASARERRTKAALVILQVSLAMVLLVGSGLMVRSLMRLWSIDPGFSADHVVTTFFELPQGRYTSPENQRVFEERWLSRLRQIPGVRDAAAMTMLPFAFDKSSSDYRIAGAPPRKTGDYQIATFDRVSPAFTDILKMPVIEGRALSTSDTAAAPPVILISESLARRHWPAGSAVGHQLLFDTEQPKTIVGVVKDVRMDGFDGRIEPTIYQPQAQLPQSASWTILSTTRSADALAADLRAALHDVDPDLPQSRVRSMADVMDDRVKKPKFTAVVLGAFAVVALIIAAIGLYGVLAFEVSQQRREIGVRVALGATRESIRSLVLGRSFRLVGAGLAVGILVSGMGARAISGLLFDAPTVDIVPVAAAAAVLTLTALVATWLPARRATSVDPIESLRAD